MSSSFAIVNLSFFFYLGPITTTSVSKIVKLELGSRAIYFNMAILITAIALVFWTVLELVGGLSTIFTG